MTTIKIRQIRSRIGCPKDQKRTLDALGLKKINKVVEHKKTPSILGMVNKVKHLVLLIEDKDESKTVSQILDEIKALPKIRNNHKKGKELIRSLGVFPVMQFFLYPNDREITRATKPWKHLIHVSELSYKPKACNSKYQRASTPYLTMFYGCIVPFSQEESYTRIISACETSSLLRAGIGSVGIETLTYSKWSIQEPLTLAALVYNPTYYNIGNEIFDELYISMNSLIDSSEYNESQKEDFRHILYFFSSEFAKQDINNEYDYFWSALFTELMCDMGFDGVIYPPVRTAGELGMNLATKPEVADEKLKLKVGAECTLYCNKKQAYISADKHITVADDMTTLLYEDSPQSTLEECLAQVGCESIEELINYSE